MFIKFYLSWVLKVNMLRLIAGTFVVLKTVNLFESSNDTKDYQEFIKALIKKCLVL